MTDSSNTGGREVCPSCGAPKQDIHETRCGYCRAVFPAAQQETTTPFKQYATFAGRQFVWAYVVMGIVVTLFISIAWFRSATAYKSVSTTTSTPQHEPTGVYDYVATLAHAGSGNDMLFLTSKNSLVRIDPVTGKPRWKSEPLGQSVQDKDILVGEDMAYVLDQTRMVAVALSNGKTAWQTSLIAEVTYGGKDAFLLTKSTVLVLEKDGSLQAFDRTTGAPVWNERLDYRPSVLPHAGNTVVILRNEGTPSDKLFTVDLVDATNGTVGQTLHIRNRDLVFHRIATPDQNSKFFFSEDGKELYIVYGFWDRCIERWSLDDGKMVWQNRHEGTNSGGTFILTDQAILVFEDRTIHAVARLNGKDHLLLEDKEYAFKPFIGNYGLVVVLAHPGWDSHLLSLWGMDALTGKKLWTATMPKSRSIRGLLESYDVKPAASGIVVAQLITENQLAIDILDVKTGVSPGRKLVQLEDVPGQFTIGADGERIWLRLKGDLNSINIATGKLEYHFD